MKRLLALIVIFIATVSSLRAETVPSVEKLRETSSTEKTLTLRFLGPEGKPIPGATARTWASPKPKNWSKTAFDIKADEHGTFRIVYEPDEMRQNFAVSVKTAGFTPYFMVWKDAIDDPLPEEHTFRLDKGKIVGAYVTDETGRRLPDAKVSFSFPWGDRQRFPRNSSCSAEATTDSNGFWRCDMVPEECLDTLTQLSVEHPEFQKTPFPVRLSTLQPNDAGEFTVTFAMKRGITVTGTVIDENGKPVAGATVFGSAGNRNYSPQQTTTDENGRFTFINWPQSKTEYILVRAEGFAPELLDRLDIHEGMQPLSVTLKPGRTIRAKVVDKHGKSVPGVRFAVERWRTQRSLSDQMFGGRKETDAEGRVRIENAPEDEIEFVLLPPRNSETDYRCLREQSLTAGDRESVITLLPAIRVVGKVFDAETKKPIPAFRVIQGIRFSGRDRVHWNEYRTIAGRDGAFENLYNDESRDFVLKIEAKGYAPKLSDEILLSEEFVELEFPLEKATDEAARGISGFVQNAEGKPVPRATVAMAVKDVSPNIYNGTLYQSTDCPTATTDEQGRFTLPVQAIEDALGRSLEEDEKISEYTLYALHRSGYARIEAKDFLEKAGNMITLEKWGRLDGTVFVGTKPGKSVELYLHFRGNNDDWEKPHAWFDYRTTADDQGRFAFEQVPPGEADLYRVVVYGVRAAGRLNTYSQGQTVLITAGETTTATVGGAGRPVTGKLALPENFEAETDWNYGVVRLRLVRSEVVFPRLEEMKKLLESVPESIRTETDPEVRRKIFKDWRETEDGKRYDAITMERDEWETKAEERRRKTELKTLAASVDRNGNFRFDDVSPGPWRFAVELDDPPPEGQCGTGEQLGFFGKDITVPEFEGTVTDEVFDLGALTIVKSQRRPRLIAVGAEAPDFELKRLGTENEEIVKLSNYRDKTVVLEFWATWCGPCLAKLPEIARLYTEKIKDNPKAELIGVSIDGDDKTVQNFLSKRQAKGEMLWPQLRTDPGGPVCERYGVFAVPAMIVVGPEGKVMAVNPDKTALEKLLE